MWRDACLQLLLGNPLVKIILFGPLFLVTALNVLVVTHPFLISVQLGKVGLSPPWTLGAGSLPDSSLNREGGTLFPGLSDSQGQSHDPSQTKENTSWDFF